MYVVYYMHLQQMVLMRYFRTWYSQNNWYYMYLVNASYDNKSVTYFRKLMMH